MDWMKIAVTLPVSHSRRINCWKCGGKRTASVTNMGKYYAVHCFRCKEKETQSPPPMTARERLALQRAAEAFEASEPELPDDFTTDIPLEGLLWLSKGGLHVDDIATYGFGWSQAMRRVILPIFSGDGTLTGVQARRVNANVYGPKYLGQVWSGPRPVWSSFHGLQQNRASGTLVLTEDILSAARVGKLCTAWSLLGTTLMPAVLSRIADSPYDDVAVWMDNDTAGINARRTILRQLGSIGIEARPVISDRDPKHHTLEEMENLLWP